LIKTKKGASVLHHQKEVWRLMNYIPECKVFNTTNDVAIAFETGKILGLFHELLKVGNPADFEVTIENFHNLAYRYDQFLEAYENATADHLKNAHTEIEFVKRNITELLSIEFDKLPIRICHNDTKLNNVLFSADKKALCLIDLDTIMPGYFMYDFGDAIRTLANPAPEDERNLSLITFDQLMFSAFLKGIQKSGFEFSLAEKDSMHFGAVLMPFLHGLRALTDYLENNKYYKVSYETQNLDRCKSLFKFADLAIDNADFMKSEIKKHLKG
jgi:serine/threonine protein kinase